LWTSTQPVACDCAPQNLARIHRRVIDRADLLAFVGDQAVALVEKQDAKLIQLSDIIT
jgi:hypothetical protein